MGLIDLKTVRLIKDLTISEKELVKLSTNLYCYMLNGNKYLLSHNKKYLYKAPKFRFRIYGKNLVGFKY